MKRKTYKLMIYFILGWFAAVVGSAAVDYSHKKEMLKLEKEVLRLKIKLHEKDLNS